VFQYLLPTLIVLVSYTMIYRKIRISDQRINASQPSALRKMNRRKKTNFILGTTSIVFFISWAPLNILNVIINTYNPFEVISVMISIKNFFYVFLQTEEALVTAFGVCHIVGKTYLDFVNCH